MKKSMLQAELSRLRTERLANEKTDGIGAVRFIVRCPLGAPDVLRRAKEVLSILDEAGLQEWPSDEEWTKKLPWWFVSACAPPMTTQQANEWLASWRKLPPNEQAQMEIEKDWALPDWLYWMQPENRQWCWWDAKAVDDIDHIVVAVVVEAWPFSWGALRWLFKTAGASDVVPEGRED
jgi:hypothetical protein